MYDGSRRWIPMHVRMRLHERYQKALGRRTHTQRGAEDPKRRHQAGRTRYTIEERGFVPPIFLSRRLSRDGLRFAGIVRRGLVQERKAGRRRWVQFTPLPDNIHSPGKLIFAAILRLSIYYLFAPLPLCSGASPPAYCLYIFRYCFCLSYLQPLRKEYGRGSQKFITTSL